MKSIPEDVLYYRPPDSAQSFDFGNGAKRVRFSRKSPCDCFLFDGHLFYALELKSVGTNSISFERTKDDSGVIHKHQIDSLLKFSQYKNVVSGFILDFRLSQKTYYLSITDFAKMINALDKKSFNEEDMNRYSHPVEIKKERLKVNWRYDVGKFLCDTYMDMIKR